MTIKETDGYWKNGSWYPYKDTVLNISKCVLSERGKIYPGKFELFAKMKLTGEEFDKWVKVCELTDVKVKEVE